MVMGYSSEFHEFDDVGKLRKAAKLLVLSQNTAATDAERKVAYHAAVRIIERNGLDVVEVDAAACKLSDLPYGSYLKEPAVKAKKRRFWRKDA